MLVRDDDPTYHKTARMFGSKNSWDLQFNDYTYDYNQLVLTKLLSSSNILEIVALGSSYCKAK